MFNEFILILWIWKLSCFHTNSPILWYNGNSLNHSGKMRMHSIYDREERSFFDLSSQFWYQTRILLEIKYLLFLSKMNLILFHNTHLGYIVSHAYLPKMEGFLCIPMLLINKNKLISDFKKYPTEWLVLSHTFFLVIGNLFGLTLYTVTHVLFYCLVFVLTALIAI